MNKDSGYLVDVGMRKFPFPMKALSKIDPDGQHTIVNISVNARINREFEARWILGFMQIVHQHRDNIGPVAIRQNIVDYQSEFKASSVRIDYEYPFFMEKITPVSKHKCMVKYNCVYSAKLTSTISEPKIIFKIEIPVITTDPSSDSKKSGGLFGQLSIITIEVEPLKDIYPETLIEMVDANALSPIYSFLTQEDRMDIIQRVHSEEKTSVMVVDDIKNKLANDPNINWYSIGSSNYGMLHSYYTLISTEHFGLGSYHDE